MPKINLCDSCQFYSNTDYVVCAVHPDGVNNEKCPDYRPDAKHIFDEQWCPEGYFYYGDELIKRPEQALTQKQQLWLLDNHPCFTGICFNCGYQYPRNCHDWECPECGCSYE